MGNVLWRERKKLWCGLPWTFTIYSVSKDKITIEYGFLSKKEDDIRLYRITDITLVRSFIQRIFGLGSIICCSSDRTSGNFVIKNIYNTKEIKDMLSDLIEKARKENRVFSREDLGFDDNFIDS